MLRNILVFQGGMPRVECQGVRDNMYDSLTPKGKPL